MPAAGRGPHQEEQRIMPDHDVKHAQDNVQDAKQDLRAAQAGMPNTDLADARQEVHEEKHDLREERREDRRD